MVRIEFIKGQGGVVNLVNGNLKSVDRDNLLNIEDIDRIIVNSTEAIAFNNDLKAMEISGYLVIFDTIESMEPYLAQMDMFDGEIFNPGVDGVQKPKWDSASRDKTEGIVPHTYVSTDIEKELKQG